MAELKPGWRAWRFDQIATNITERIDDPSEAGVERYVGLEHLDSDSLKIRRWGAPSDVTATKLRFYPGDIIFGRRRVYQRKLGIAEFDGICSAHAMVLRANPEVVTPEFLPFFMQSDLFMERALEISVGSLSPTINWRTLAAQEFALPPLDEQRRIAELLNSIHKARDSYHNLLAALTTVEAAYLLEIFGDYLKPKQNAVRVSLRELAYIQSGIAKGRRPQAGKTSEVPYLGVSNVQDGFLDLSDVKLITVDNDKIDRYLLKPGDVLMTEGGDPDKLGRGTVWQGEIDGCVHQNHLFAIRTNAELLNPWYLAAVLRSSYGKQYFLSCAKRTSNLATINKRQVGDFLVPLPSLVAQNCMVEQWQAMTSTSGRTRRPDEKLENMQKSVLGNGTGE